MTKTFKLTAVAAIIATGSLVAVPFNTGVNDAGGLLPTGATDSHWSLTYSLGTTVTPIVVTAGPVGSPWVANTASAQWISPYVSGTSVDPWLSDPVGLFTYTQSYTFDAARLVTIAFASDNVATLKLDGTTTLGSNAPYGYPNFQTWTSVSYLLPAGTHSLVFEVDNASGSTPTGNPSGLIVQIPDGGSTLALAGLGMVALGLLRRKLA